METYLVPSTRALLLDSERANNGINVAAIGANAGSCGLLLWSVLKAIRSSVMQAYLRQPGQDDRRFVGMGPGLYICRGIAEQHGGQTWVDSQPNKGSTFHMTLPIPTREEQRERGEEAKGQVAIEEVRLDA